MNTQVQVIATQAQVMAAQTNSRFGPRVQENASTTASRLRDFTSTNQPMFFGSKVNEDPQDFIDEVYKILYAMGLTLNERMSYIPIN